MTQLYAALAGDRMSVAFPTREDDIHLDLPVNVLASYHFFRSTDMAELASWGLRVIADSGAFSAESAGAVIPLPDYAAWIRRWRPCLHWVASLDVIGDAAASWDNWRALSATGVSSVPTIHYPADPRELDRYVEAGADLIGLGGMVPFRSEPQRLLRWCAQVMAYAKRAHPDLRFHGWGITHPALLLNLPWWSVDSSGYSSAYRYGRLRLFDPDKGRMVSVDVRVATGREIAGVHRLLAEHYGLEDWRRIATSHKGTRRDLCRTSLRSFQLMERFMSGRWQVTPPASVADGQPGPTLHAVLGSPAMQPARSLSPHDRPPKELPA